MIYLDNNATTQPLSEVVEAMLPFYREFWGNPSSLHHFGAQVKTHLDAAREAVAALLGANRPSEIVFTAGGTEANNLAIRGLLQKAPHKKHIITSSVEHSSVNNLSLALEKEGYSVTFVPVDRDGKLDWEFFEKSFRDDTALVTIMWSNNETGVLFPIEKIDRLCREKKVLLHVDAIQTVGKLPIRLAPMNIATLSIAAHKMHGPKGIGALYVRRGTPLAPQILGGSQEKGLRAGTENVPHMIGFGKAATLAAENLRGEKMKSVAALRDRFEATLMGRFSFVQRNGAATPRVPNTTALCFKGLSAETILLLLSEEGICVSTGAACSAGHRMTSRILDAMGLSAEEARGTLRISLSCQTTPAEIDQALAGFEKVLLRLKN